MEFRKKRNPRFQCGHCGKKCVTDVLKCGMCQLWFHSNCQSVTAAEFEKWSDNTLDFICVKCRSIGDEFDYPMAMERLRQAAHTKNDSRLKEAVEREILFKTVLDLPRVKPQDTDYPAVDPIASEVINRYSDDIKGTPRKTTGDGNCLYNAVSILLTGGESLSVQLRYHTCLNLVRNMDKYLMHPLRSKILNFTCSYWKTCMDSATPGSFSNAWTLIALSDVVGLPIRVIYPYANGRRDLAYQTFNTIFEPIVPTGDRQLSVLWFKMGAVPRKGHWYAVDHFAAVTDTQSIPADRQYEEWISPKRTKTNTSTQMLEDEIDVLNHRSRFECLISDDETSVVGSDDEDSDEDIESLSTPPPKKKTQRNAPDFNELPSENFLSNDGAFKELLTTKTDIKSIPRGKKTNVYIVINHQPKEGHNTFVDDCGVWESQTGKTVNHNFILRDDNSLKTVYKKNGLFCERRNISKISTYIEIEPQPKDIVTMNRYYIKLKGNENFKRRITVITQAPDRIDHIKYKALIEYVGENRKTKTVHGNSKRAKSYTRTDPVILEEGLKYVNKSNKASEAVAEMCKQDEVNAPKSARQLQDKVYRERIKMNKQRITKKQNVADEVWEMINSVHDDFVKEASTSYNKEPVFILYTEEQMLDMKRNCEGKNGSVIGVDRTFNLGKVFVTATSYKNRAVISNKTGQYPVFLGPMCLHFDAEQSTYHKFFSHLRDAIRTQDLTFGSDDEKALRNALNVNFPDSRYVLCTKHIKDNVRNYLQQSGVQQRTKEQIIHFMFNNKDGLVFSESDEQFEARESNLEYAFENHPKFQIYYNKYLRSKLMNSVSIPLRQKTVTRLWTNNNAESINNRLKEVADWKQHKLPELSRLLKTVSDMQILNLKRAQYGRGDYTISEGMQAHFVTEDVWFQKTPNEQSDEFIKFLRARIPEEKSNFVFAASANFKCKRPSDNVGKKPGQRKRPKAERAPVMRHK